MSQPHGMCIRDAVDEIERHDQRMRLLMCVWLFLDGFVPDRPGETPAQLISGTRGLVRARVDVVRALQAECLVASGAARRQMEKFLAVATIVPSTDDEDAEPEVFAGE